MGLHNPNGTVCPQSCDEEILTWIDGEKVELRPQIWLVRFFEIFHHRIVSGQQGGHDLISYI